MTEKTRCEPPPEWRDRNGWHWVERRNGRHPSILYWNGLGRWISPGRPAYGPDVLTEEGYRYIDPVTPPATVAALVEALEGLMQGHRWQDAHTFIDGTPIGAGWARKVMPEDDALTAARAALALYRGERT